MAPPALRPMLAQSTHPSSLPAFIEDPNWHLEQKLDGQRMMVVVTNGEVQILNRAGQPKTTNLSTPVIEQFACFDSDHWVFDGEVIDKRLHVFDLPTASGLVLPDTCYAERRHVLEVLWNEWHPDERFVQLTPNARTTEEKARLVRIAQAEQLEGVMAKHVDGLYQPGRRSTRMLKAKFVSDLDGIIRRVREDGKENAVIALLDPENRFPHLHEPSAPGVAVVGTASTIGKRPTPEPGQVWRVRYAYFTTADERLYQPRLVEIRTEKDMSECLVDQLVTTSKKMVDKDRLSS